MPDTPQAKVAGVGMAIAGVILLLITGLYWIRYTADYNTPLGYLVTAFLVSLGVSMIYSSANPTGKFTKTATIVFCAVIVVFLAVLAIVDAPDAKQIIFSNPLSILVFMLLVLYYAGVKYFRKKNKVL